MVRKRIRRIVANVIDGDTFRVKRRIGNSNVVRIANFNAPEKHQFGGQMATNRLRGMISGRKVTIKPVAIDSYGRVVADVVYNRRNISKRLKKGSR